MSLRPPQFSHVVEEWDAGSSHHEYVKYCAGRQVVRYDPRGTGLSERNCVDYGLDVLVEDVEAVLHAVGAHRVVVDAISSSALTGLEFARRHPSRVERLVVQNAFLDGHRWWTNPVRRALVNIAEVDWQLCTETWAWLTWGDERRGRTLRVARYIQDCTQPEAFLRMVAAERRVDLRGELDGLTMPTLVLNHPRFSRMAPEEHNAEVARELPGSRLHTIHSMRDRVQAILRFLSGPVLFDESGAQARTRIEGGASVLSGREVEVLQLLAEGLTNRAISDRLVVSVRTVDAHLRNIFAKTETTSRAGAAAFGIRNHLL